MTESTNFEVLLHEATEQYCEAWVNQIMSEPISEKINARERRRFKRMWKRAYAAEGAPICRQMPRLSPWKIVLIAALLALTAALAACVCIPKVRETIKDIILNCRTEYVEVDFREPAAIIPLAENENAALVPTIIEKKAYVSGLPCEYIAEVNMDSDNIYCVSYYYDDKYVFSLSQKNIGTESLWSNSVNHNIKKISVNGYAAILREEKSLPNSYMVVWQDKDYEYCLSGLFTSMSDAIQKAESTKVIVKS